MSIILDIQQHEQTGEAMFWMGKPISACRSIAMRRGWERAREQFEIEARQERALWGEGSAVWVYGAVTK